MDREDASDQLPDQRLKRGSNPHAGSMIKANVTSSDEYRVRTLHALTDRPVIDIVLFALMHKHYYPSHYTPLEADDELREVLHLRVSKAIAGQWNDQAWEVDMARSHWLGAVLNTFFRVTDFNTNAETLYSCADLAHLLENPRV